MLKSRKNPSNFLTVMLRWMALPVIVLLIVYNLRRLVFTLATFFPKKTPLDNNVFSQDPEPSVPEVLILVPCRDEEEMIPGLCQALSGLDYPQDRLSVVLIDDGSRDQTLVLMEEQVQQRPRWQLLSFPKNEGKANALNIALAQVQYGEIVVVYDADHRPEPDSIRRLVKYFEQENVAGVSGRTRPINPMASPSAYYASVESYLHQMVTMRAKDRLDLAPALLGSNCAYRRTFLAECGGFRKGALLEDSDLTLVFYRAGYRIRFAEDVVAYHQVPETVEGYLKQHLRWGRGFNDLSQNHLSGLLRGSRISIPVRVELFFFSTGYLDRVAMAGAGMLTLLSFFLKSTYSFPYGVLFLGLVVPLIQLIGLFCEQRLPLSYWRRLPWIPFFFLLDIFVALRSQVDTLLNRPRIWGKTKRWQMQY